MKKKQILKSTLIFIIYLAVNNLIQGQTCTLQASACNDCMACDGSNVSDISEGIAINAASQFGVDFGLGLTQIPIGNYNAVTNIGTLNIPAGTTNVFSVSGVRNLPLPDDIISFCYTADINVISGSNFIIEFRIENGFGDPGSGFPALQTTQAVNGPGTCSIGGNWTLDPADLDDFDNLNGFSFTPNPSPTSNAFVLVFDVADFSNNPVSTDIEVELSNIQFSYCTPSTGPDVPVFLTPGTTIKVGN